MCVINPRRNLLGILMQGVLAKIKSLTGFRDRQTTSSLEQDLNLSSFRTLRSLAS